MKLNRREILRFAQNDKKKLLFSQPPRYLLSLAPRLPPHRQERLYYLPERPAQKFARKLPNASMKFSRGVARLFQHGGIEK